MQDAQSKDPLCSLDKQYSHQLSGTIPSLEYLHNEKDRPGRAVFFVMPYRSRLQSRIAPLVVANTDGIFCLEQEDFAVSDLTSSSVFKNSVNKGFNAFVRNDDLETQFGDEIDLILSTSVVFAVTFLAPMSPNFRDSYAVYANLSQSILHFIELARSNDRFYFRHCFPRLICNSRVRKLFLSTGRDTRGGAERRNYVLGISGDAVLVEIETV